MARMPAEHAVCLYADMHFFLFLANTYFVLQSSRKGHQATNAANGWTCPLIPVTDALEPLAWMPVDALQEHVPLALCLSRGKVFVYEIDDLENNRFQVRISRKIKYRRASVRLKAWCISLLEIEPISTNGYRFSR